jgi:hypothetical protein
MNELTQNLNKGNKEKEKEKEKEKHREVKGHRRIVPLSNEVPFVSSSLVFRVAL